MELVKAGAQMIVSPSASPFVLRKMERHRQILAVRDCRDQGIGRAGQVVPGRQADAVLMFRFRRLGNRIMHRDIAAEGPQFLHQIGNL